MRLVIDSITGEFRRYKALAEGAVEQLTDEQLVVPGPGSGNSVATICWHVGGNLRSRFTEFLTTDGEKPWRDRDEELSERLVTKAELLVHWQRGWGVLRATLATLDDSQLDQHVTIRGQSLTVLEALHRSLAHASYHTGQIVYAARALRGGEWRFLSIPPGGSAAYNAAPTRDQPDAQAAAIGGSSGRSAPEASSG